MRVANCVPSLDSTLKSLKRLRVSLKPIQRFTLRQWIFLSIHVGRAVQQLNRLGGIAATRVKPCQVQHRLPLAGCTGKSRLKIDACPWGSLAKEECLDIGLLKEAR